MRYYTRLILSGSDPMSSSKVSIFDSLASAYDTWFDQEGKLIFASEVEALKQVLPLLPKPWIELGLGSGRFAQALGIAVGLDPSSELLNMAKNRGISVFLGRGEEAPFKDNVFGTVFLIVTLCFVDSPERILSEAARFLRDEGKVVLGLILRESPWGQLYQIKKEMRHRFYRYATFYSYVEVDMLLKQTGFSAEKVISTLFQNPSKVNHIEVPQQGFSRDAGFTVVLASKSSSRR
ncbi:MAG: class I SAM-dependent methyltransferase [Chloroflexi bacterium CG07_land_8_20_14_0_80_45_17]|nr:MAG: methyltransferase type 11 [Chloroflexi bacterium CG23_combo_of_CG06-09_8_20_14_all_45_10]PIU56627.1 MAG: class I SAM-dependent methyltransferase [Chloroflexi bacterium CG07_land_8_20_14_0_80_45_17]